MTGGPFPLPYPPGARRASPATGVRLPRPRPRVVLALALTLLMAGGAWWWLRDSAVAGVTDVSVTGIAGPQAPAIRAALTSAGRDMTTLDVREAALRAAVARYPVVRDVRAVGHFPHGLSITVVQQVPVAVLRSGAGTVAVAADGTLLRGVPADGVATITLASPPAGARLRDPLALAQLRILAAAPEALRGHVARLFTGGRGLELRLADGPVVAFGAPRRLAAKWMALVAVLADPASAGAGLIDLSVPERPAAAGLEPLTPAPDPATAATADGHAGAAAPAAGTTATPPSAPTPTAAP